MASTALRQASIGVAARDAVCAASSRPSCVSAIFARSGTNQAYQPSRPPYLGFFEGPLAGFDELANVRWSHHDDAILFLVPRREAGMVQTIFQISGTGPTL